MAVLPPLVLELRAKAGEVHSEIKKVGSEVTELSEKTEGGMSKSSKAFHGLATAGKALTSGIVGAGLAVATFGLEAVQTAQVADAKLSTAVKNVGGNMEELEPEIKKTDTSMRALGYTNAETNTALAALTTSLGSPKKALADMAVVTDLARMKNISLSQSALLVAKASEGQTRPLKALGIDLPVYAGGAQNVKLAQMALAKAQEAVNAILKKTPGAIKPTSKAHAEYVKATEAAKAAQLKLSATQNSGAIIMAALTKRVQGSAEAYGKTMPGQIDAAKAQLDDLGEKVGTLVIPRLTQLLTVGNEVMHWMEQHKPVAEALGAVIGGVLATAITAYVASLVVAAATSIASFASMAVAGLAWGASMLAAGAMAILPFLPIIVAVAAVALAGYELYKHWGTIWGGIKAIAVDAEHWAQEIFENRITQSILAVVAPGLYLATHWRQVWGDIEGIALDGWRFLDGKVIHPITTGFDTLVGYITGLPGRIRSAAAGMFDGISDAFRSAINCIISGWDSLHFGVPGFSAFGHKIGGFDVSVPQIPYLATGGPLNLTGWNVVGEAGPELVGPGGRVFSNRDSSKILNSSTSSGSGGSGGGSITPLPPSGGSGGGRSVTVNVRVDGHVTSDQDLVSFIRNELLKMQSRTARQGVPVYHK